MSFQIAIDGPAGAGKSTIARRTAKELGFLYIDTGAMYRALGLYVLDSGISLEDEAAIEACLPGADIQLTMENGEQHVLLNGCDVNSRIRTEEAGMAASKVSTYRAVRKKLVECQQKIAGSLNVIMDGRDIGTVVLRNAPLKVFLTASPHIRAVRRKEDLALRGTEADLQEIEADIRKRDEQDMNRTESPLRQAEDAVCIDSSDLTIEEVTDKILALVRERMGSEA